MNRNVLEQNAIYFEENVNRIGTLPLHAQSLRAAILDFDWTIPDRLSCENDHELEVLEAEGFRGIKMSESERRQILETLEKCTEAKEEARILSQGRDREAEWVDHYVKWFFDPLSQASHVKDEDTRQISRTKFYYDYFERAKGRPWSLFGNKSQFRTGCSGLPEPKPDWVAYFPIYNSTAGDRIPDSRRWCWRNSPKASIIENFSRETLQVLADKGLQSNAAGIFRQGGSNSIVMSDYLCFPWLIVEHKKAEHEDHSVYCYCQAANAGMGALMMLHTLAKFAEKRPDDAHIPPVITLTTADGVVRVWIMYVAGRGKYYEMKCVWEGAVTNVIDHLKLQAILENCHTWAVRVLRPWISGYIDLWKNMSSLEGPNPAPNNDSGDIQHDWAEEIGALINRLTLEVEGDHPCDSEEEDSKLRAFWNIIQEDLKTVLGLQHDQHQHLRSSSLNPLLSKQVASTTRDFGTQTDIEPGPQNEKSEAIVGEKKSPYNITATHLHSFSRLTISESRKPPSPLHLSSGIALSTDTQPNKLPLWPYHAAPDGTLLYQKKVPWRNEKSIKIRFPVGSGGCWDRTKSVTHSGKFAEAPDAEDTETCAAQLAHRIPITFGGAHQTSDFADVKFDFCLQNMAQRPKQQNTTHI